MQTNMTHAFRHIASLFMLAALVSCSKEETGNNTPADTYIYLTASLDSQTPQSRMVIDDDGKNVLKLKWEIGDTVYGEYDVKYPPVLVPFKAIEISEDGKSARFAAYTSYDRQPDYVYWAESADRIEIEANGDSGVRFLNVAEPCTAERVPYNNVLYAKPDGNNKCVFKPLLAIMRFDLKLPAEVTAITSFQLENTSTKKKSFNPNPQFILYPKPTEDQQQIMNPDRSNIFTDDTIDIPVTDGKVVVYVCMPPTKTSESDGTINITINQKFVATNNFGTLVAGKVASIRKTAKDWKSVQ